MNFLTIAKKVMLRNMEALQYLNMGSLSIRTEQVNVTPQQLNQLVKGNRKQNYRGSLQNIQRPTRNPAGDRRVVCANRRLKVSGSTYFLLSE